MNQQLSHRSLFRPIVTSVRPCCAARPCRPAPPFLPFLLLFHPLHLATGPRVPSYRPGGFSNKHTRPLERRCPVIGKERKARRLRRQPVAEAVPTRPRARARHGVESGGESRIEPPLVMCRSKTRPFRCRAKQVCSIPLLGRSLAAVVLKLRI